MHGQKGKSHTSTVIKKKLVEVDYWNKVFPFIVTFYLMKSATA